MTEFPQAINHSPIQTPTIFWTDDSIFLHDAYAKPVWKMWKQSFSRINKYCKIKRILDASGKSFAIDRFEEIPSQSRLSAFFREKYWMTWVTPVIISEKQLSLEEFKKEVLRAVKARYSHDDPGSGMVERTMEKLPQARTFREVIEALPDPL